MIPRGAIPPDQIRTVVSVVAAWVATALCLGRSAPWVESFALAVAVAGAVLLIRCRPHGRRAAGAAFGLLTVALVLLPLGARIAHFRDSPLARLAAARRAVTVQATVTDDPHEIAAQGVSGSPRVSVSTRAGSVTVGAAHLPVRGAILVIGEASGWRSVTPGQRVRITGTLQDSLDPRHLGVVLLAASGPSLLGRPPWWQRGAQAVRESFRAVCVSLPGDVAGLLPGIVDGDTTGLDPVLREHFRTAGLTHLVAVSGMNCSVLVGAVLLCLRRFGARPWLSAGVGLLVIVLFVVVARPSPSVLRAAVMAALAMAALAVGRPRQAVGALSISVLALLLWQPELAINAGFIMSVLATAALLTIAPHWAELLRQHRCPGGLAELLAAAAAAHAVSAPVIAALSGRVSLVAVPANMLAEPVVAVTTIVGFVAAGLSPLSPALAGAAAHIAAVPCRWLVWVGNYFGQLPGGTLPWPAGMRGALWLAAVLVAVAVLSRFAGFRRAVLAATLVALAIQIPVRTVTASWPAAGWIVVACDVGQGDAIVVRTAPREAILVDTGPSPVAVDRCLHDLGVVRIRLLVLTHFHLDHVGGLSGALRDRRIDTVWSSPLAEPASGVRLVTDALDRTGPALLSVTAGLSRDVGPVHLDVLSPAAAFHRTRSDPNNSSVVIRAAVQGRTILLTGDAEVEAQQAMLASGAHLEADVMKVPHHGSAHSSEAFLDAVHADLDLISVGQGNDYGLPAPSLLAMLERTGASVRRTDHDGDVAVTVRAGRLGAVIRGRTASAHAGGGPHVDDGDDRSDLPPTTRAAAAVSGTPARMGSCRSVQFRSTTCRQIRQPVCCSSATRSCWSAAPSARSPPRCAGVTRTSSRPNGPAATSTVPNCTSCSDRHCSGTRVCWFFAAVRI